MRKYFDCIEVRCNNPKETQDLDKDDEDHGPRGGGLGSKPQQRTPTPIPELTQLHLFIINNFFDVNQLKWIAVTLASFSFFLL